MRRANLKSGGVSVRQGFTLPLVDKTTLGELQAAIGAANGNAVSQGLVVSIAIRTLAEAVRAGVKVGHPDLKASDRA